MQNIDQKTAEYGFVMALQDFSVNDGEGLRTTIFLAGCPLSCKWCANPEGQTVDNPLVQKMSAEQVLDHVRRQMIFFRRSGGVTFSGGEPTMQAPFLRRLVNACYDMGLSLAIETCGDFEFTEVADILEKMDLIFMDLKIVDAEAHQAFTGRDNERIIENMMRIAAHSMPFVVRIPVIEGVNTNEKDMNAALDLICRQGPQAKVEFLPYHEYGRLKYDQLEKQWHGDHMRTPSEACLSHFKALAQSKGLEVVSYR